MSTPIRVVAAVIRRKDTLLVCQRPLHKRHGGLWEFPGGKCEPGESDAEAIRRELMEELGVEAVAVGEVQLETADPDSPYVIAFLSVSIAGELNSTEHTELAWTTLPALRRLPLAPSDQRYVEYIGQAMHVRDPS